MTTKNTRRDDALTTVAVGAGIVVGAAAFYAGLKTGINLKQLTQDYQAHTMIVTRLREDAPELVDSTVTTVIEQMNGILKAAN